MAGLKQGRVCIFGAGGPVGAMAQQALEDTYTLRLTDIRSVEAIRAGEPQSPDAPLPTVPEPPHEWRIVDVGDYDAVRAAADGMDALINVSVLRHDLNAAFRVNTVGAYNVMKAAVECGIKRVIHTGPRHTILRFEGDYWPDFHIPDEAPLHPGSDLYALSKYLGGEIVRVFAEAHDLEVIVFLYCLFRPADGGEHRRVFPYQVAWEDTGTPFLHALRVDSIPSNYEVFDIVADLPHGKWSPAKAERLLGWRPQHNFEHLYR